MNSLVPGACIWSFTRFFCGNLGESRLKDLPILTESGISAEFGRDVKAMLNAEKTFLEEQAKERLQRALQCLGL